MPTYPLAHFSKSYYFYFADSDLFSRRSNIIDVYGASVLASGETGEPGELPAAKHLENTRYNLSKRIVMQSGACKKMRETPLGQNTPREQNSVTSCCCRPRQEAVVVWDGVSQTWPSTPTQRGETVAL